MSANNIPAGLKVPTQTPLDAKVHVASQAVLSNLGTSNNLAFTYYEGMIVYCVAEKTRWEWREVGGTGTKLLGTDFTYPNNLIVDGVTYSNRIFNFYQISVQGPLGSGTLNYVSKWTPDGNTLGNSQIQDNGSSVSVNSSLNPDRRLSVVTSAGTAQTAVYGETVTSGYIGVVGSNIGVGPGSNIGVYGTAQGNTDYNYGVGGSGASTSTATGIGVTGDAYGTGLSIGIRANAISGSQKYAVQLIDGTEGIGKVLTCTGSQGKANWATPTTGVAGSGTVDYLARWYPDGNTLTTGTTRDNGTSVGINAVPDANVRLVVSGSTLNGLYSITNRVATGSSFAFGINGASNGISTLGENVGVYGTAGSNTNVNYGIYGGCSGTTTGKNIGLRGVASNGAAGNYAIQLQDGTQAAGKFLKSITSNGEANWANITSSDTTGATGSFTSNDGKTITVTNGLITSIVP